MPDRFTFTPDQLDRETMPDGYAECSGCGEWFGEGDVHVDGGVQYCDECFEVRFEIEKALTERDS